MTYTLTQNWEPIGWDNTTPNSFTGSLIGDNHTIYNLTIDNSSSNNIGFFSELSGNITNLNFENLIIRGRLKLVQLLDNKTSDLPSQESSLKILKSKIMLIKLEGLLVNQVEQ